MLSPGLHTKLCYAQVLTTGRTSFNTMGLPGCRPRRYETFCTMRLRGGGEALGLRMINLDHLVREAALVEQQIGPPSNRTIAGAAALL